MVFNKWNFKNGFYQIKVKNFDLKISTKETKVVEIRYDVWLKQIHSNIVHIVDDKNLPKGDLEGDGLIIKIKNITGCIKVADCYPTFILDTENNIGAILHVGWRGSSLGILKNCLEILTSKFNSKIENLITIFGPGICKNCYEVKEDMFEYFPREFFYFKDGKIYLDLLGYNKKELNNLGISQIIDPPACTYEDSLLYSYRRDKTDKRIYATLSIN